MIPKELYGVSPTYDLRILDVPVDPKRIVAFKLSMNEHQHDMLTISMVGIPPRAVTDYQDAPVTLLAHTGAFKETFTGYVRDIRPEYEQGTTVEKSPFYTADIVCLGTSSDMRGKQNKAWKGYAFEQVIEELSRKYGWSYSIPITGMVYPAVVQGNESDWQFLNRFTKMHGYGLTFHDTHLHVYDPYVADNRAVSSHKLTTNSNGDMNPVPGRILQFKGNFYAESTTRDYSIAVQAANGSVYEVSTGTGADRVDRVDEYAPSHSVAERIIKSKQIEEYDYTATAKTLGLLGAKPGGVVDITYQAAFDGLWYVQSVTHEIAKGSFVTTLAIARNIDSELHSPSAVEQYRMPPPPVLSDGAWKSSKVSRNVY